MTNDIYMLILEETFWQKIVYALAIFDPLVQVFQMVDSDDCIEMDFLYDVMNRSKEAILKSVKKDTKNDEPSLINDGISNFIRIYIL